MGLFDGFQRQLDAMPRAVPQKTGLLGGVQNFLSANRGQGGFMERLNMFGAQLQDIGDGGQRATGIQQQRQQATSREEEARQRQEINRLAQTLDLTPQQRLLFAASPENFFKSLTERETPYTLNSGQSRYAGSEELASRPADPVTLNTSRGVYQVNGTEGGFLEEFEENPLEDELLRARIAATRSQAGQRDAQAARARRPVGGASSSRASQASAPAAAPWTRRW